MIGPMDHDRHLRHAARLALRGHGGAEPNPMVGCVIVSSDQRVVGWGYHRACGTEHAEIHALRRAGDLALGATAYVTLEPCNHDGRTGPCAAALIEAGIKRVVIARLDPNPRASGGAQRLRDAGIEVIVHPHPQAVALSDPFAHRVNTPLPWVIAKWAQTVDGCIATRTGHSQWISGDASRRFVHRERGRVDAILTGIGTVFADDPLLTARNVRTRRVARRVVVDPNLEIPLNGKLVMTAGDVPLVIACHARVRDGNAAKVKALEQAGAEVLPINSPASTSADDLSLEELLRQLVQRYDVTNVLVEAGPGLLSRLFQLGLVNEAWVFIAPLLIGDHCAPAAVGGMNVDRVTDGTRLQLIDHRQRGSDIVLRYRVNQSTSSR